MSRVFLMKWYHFSVEYFEDLRNVNHCEFLIMNKQESGKYILENKLRTWSELRRERALQAAKEKGDKGEKGEKGEVKQNGTSKDSSKLDKAHNPSSLAVSSPVEVRRRWGGCPNGCNHDKNFKIRQNLADLVKSDSSTSSHPPPNGSHGDDGPRTDKNVNPPTIHMNASFNGNGEVKPLASRRPAGKRFQAQNADAEEPEEAGPQIDVTKAREDVVSSPDGTPSFISVEDRLRAHLKSPALHGNCDDSDDSRHRNHHHRLLHVGRDGGGTYSGHNSVAASDADSSEDDQHRRRRMAAALRPKLTTTPSTSNGTGMILQSESNSNSDDDDHASACSKQRGGSNRMGRGTRANRLGDAPHSSDGEHEADTEPEPDDELCRAERDDRSVQGSVY
jgi:hypothetical protein